MKKTGKVKNINLKQLALFRLIEKNVLTENEAKTLNALFENGQQGFFELEKNTWIEAQELSEALKSLEKQKALRENRGFYSSDFFEAMERLLAEKEQAVARA